MFKAGYVELLVIVSLVPIFNYAQEVRWMYRYSGVVAVWRDDQAKSIAYGSDGNIYVAGDSWQDGTGNDFTIISLTDAGIERWIYTYNEIGDRGDGAIAIVYGEDDNIYAGGFSTGSDTTHDITVVSLTSTGAERWVYQHNGPGNGPDYAYDVCYGNDGNIYVVGSCWGANGNTDFTVASVTDSGTERWVYTYNGPGNHNDCARSVVYGSDGNLYAVGESYGSGTNDDFTVISLTTAGTERWVYRYNGLGNWADYANAVVSNSDGNVYVTGSTTGFYGSSTTIICFNSQGVDQWIYIHPENYFDDSGYDGILGGDNNLYVAGIYGSDIPDFMVISATDSGGPRWEYIYYTPVFTFEAAMSIVYGGDDYVYAAGHIAPDSGFGWDIGIISLTTSGSEQWVYRYDRCGEADIANAVCYGNDGYVYAAGMTTDSISGGDFTVISLTTGPGICENTMQFGTNNSLQIDPNPFAHTTRISSSILDVGSTSGETTLSIYDIAGRLVKSFDPGSNVVWDGRDNNDHRLPQGVYFVRLETGNYIETMKTVKLK